MQYYDISPTISPRTAVFPGDVPFSRQVAMSFEQGHHLLLSSIAGTVHIGAHADAPNHYHKDGQDMAARSLHYYMGSCQVVHTQIARGERIKCGDVDLEAINTPRVLFRTDSFPNPDFWNSDFNSLSPELIQALAQKGVVLVGIDTPSVDPETSKELESHQTIYANDLAVLEGIVLTQVPAGTYTLIALPLKIEAADASPVRAILLPPGGDWLQL